MKRSSSQETSELETVLNKLAGKIASQMSQLNYQVGVEANQQNK